eukprot:TRINITY_DN3199_c0_g1_i1.p1 TRINITY_DN3199_c0_g1~~TRINITY_DN3199_c0_g1_i1.p1  ORF type:complete len:564 (-),score=129.32 TRINITY_DN3199_c0_g1_i1:79-1770(-)
MPTTEEHTPRTRTHTYVHAQLASLEFEEPAETKSSTTTAGEPKFTSTERRYDDSSMDSDDSSTERRLGNLPPPPAGRSSCAGVGSDPDVQQRLSAAGPGLEDGPQRLGGGRGSAERGLQPQKLGGSGGSTEEAAPLPHKVVGDAAGGNADMTLLQVYVFRPPKDVCACWTVAVLPTCSALDLSYKVLELASDQNNLLNYALYALPGKAKSPTLGAVRRFLKKQGLPQVSPDQRIGEMIAAQPKATFCLILEEATQHAAQQQPQALAEPMIVLDSAGDDGSVWIPENQVELTDKISSGSFAKVYKAMFHGDIVAVKVLKGRLDEKIVIEFKKEFSILKATKHPNLVEFYGACLQPKLSMVIEYCQRGTLVHVMTDATFEFTWAYLLSFSRQAVQGLGYLHNLNPPIIHRDLKSLNLLVTADYKVKLADFGLSRFNTISNNTTLGKLCGTMSHCAPEIFQGVKFSTSSDMFSMGMILWEMVERLMSGHYSTPFSEFTWINFDFQIIVQAAEKNLRPTIPATCPTIVRQLVEALWDKSPVCRPTAADMLGFLDVVEQRLGEEKLIA